MGERTWYGNKIDRLAEKRNFWRKQRGNQHKLASLQIPESFLGLGSRKHRHAIKLPKFNSYKSADVSFRQKIYWTRFYGGMGQPTEKPKWIGYKRKSKRRTREEKSYKRIYCCSVQYAPAGRSGHFWRPAGRGIHRRLVRN